MSILYGVQATGNGHITRARVMAQALEREGIEVDYLFSGREPEKLFNMEPFGNYQCRRGLTFYMQGSKVDHWKTFTRNNVVQLLRDIRALDLTGYDLVITDFEPVTAWAAKLKGVKSVGIAHQYAFLHNLPDKKSGTLLKAQVKAFAPANIPIGLHWDRFDQDICPPLIQKPLFSPSLIEKKVVVYLPHDDLEVMMTIFKQCSQAHFFIYSSVDQPLDQGNCHIRPFSRMGFQQDLSDCEGVICNAGFGLLSEALQYGKKIMTLPQKGQAEQESNAEVLEILGLGRVVAVLDGQKIGAWLESAQPEPFCIPDVATPLAKWIKAGCNESIENLIEETWLTKSTYVTA